MAIDNREKRQSAASIPHMGANVTPNASKDQEWRQQVGYAYSGITVGGAGPAFKPFFAMRCNNLL